MKTLSYYKNRYRKAKTSATHAKVLNGAMSNLSNEDQQKFLSWQIDYMNKH